MERSQLRWFTHLTGLPRGRFLNEMFQARPGRRRPWGRYKMYWRDYISWLVFPRQTGGSGQVSLLRLLPLQTGNDNWPCTRASCTAYRAMLVTNAIWYLDESIQLSYMLLYIQILRHLIKHWKKWSSFRKTNAWFQLHLIKFILIQHIYRMWGPIKQTCPAESSILHFSVKTSP